MKVGDSYIPENFYFTQEHAWALMEDSGTVKIGITDYAQRALREIKFVYMPKIGITIKRADVIAHVESIKAISEVYSPLSGRIIEINRMLTSSPESINEDPYGKGWIVAIYATDLEEEKGKLLEPTQYARHIKKLIKIDKNLLIYRWKKRI